MKQKSKNHPSVVGYKADQWVFNTEDSSTEAKFEHMRLDAKRIELVLFEMGIELNSINYKVSYGALFVEMSFNEVFYEIFQSVKRNIWCLVREDMPTHRNDYWYSMAEKPDRSLFVNDPKSKCWTLSIRLNTKSKRYVYPDPEDLLISERVKMAA